MTGKPSRVRPHLPVLDTEVPKDPLIKKQDEAPKYCRDCGLPIKPGDPRHTLPDRPAEADSRERAAGEAGEQG